jgi:D-alanyl-D-alanine carboxypeptidase/D-alanyl-D-alanine-endopeptidase (penicillin-binding protein 4)
MKYTKYLLLLLLLASCASKRTVNKHRSYQADTRPAVPATVQVAMPVVEEEEVDEPEPVLSARPLVSQVHRFPAGTWQAAKQQALDSLCLSPLFETTQLGLYVYDLTDGEPLYAVNAAHRMRPASCQKVVTAITALHFLKDNYQLKTDFLIRGRVNAGILNGDLIVVGGMDPMVSAEELLQAAASIRQQQGIESIAGNIVYDFSMREDAPYGWGWCWDDDYGPLSALLVDGKDGFEQKWNETMEMAGIKVKEPQQLSHKGKEQKGTVVYSIRHGIDELLEPMMKNSDNIYAECLFYQTAATKGKKGAGRKEAAQRTEELLKSIGLDSNQYKVADGSGLSLYNYVSAEMLVAMLGYAWRNEKIKAHLLPSLPIAGYDGTLQKRMTGTVAEGNVHAKTGTVTGISSLAGYLTAVNGHTLAFAIINQGISTSSIGRTFQDKVCEELCK